MALVPWCWEGYFFRKAGMRGLWETHVAINTPHTSLGFARTSPLLTEQNPTTSGVGARNNYENPLKCGSPHATPIKPRQYARYTPAAPPLYSPDTKQPNSIHKPIVCWVYTYPTRIHINTNNPVIPWLQTPYPRATHIYTISYLYPTTRHTHISAPPLDRPIYQPHI